MKSSCRYSPLMALSNSLRRRKGTSIPDQTWFPYHLPSPILPPYSGREGRSTAKRTGTCCVFPVHGSDHWLEPRAGKHSWSSECASLGGLFLYPLLRSLSSEPCICTYLCLSLMSTGLHTEPYRVSCHCRRMPTWSGSFPRAANRRALSHPSVGHAKERSPAHPTTQGGSDHSLLQWLV